MNTLHAGEKAPDFSLQDQHNQTITLADFIGKQWLLVYFYPKAMTPGCTVQAQGIRDHAQAFAELNTKVFAISPDQSKRLTKFAERDELNFTLLADPEHQVAESYGVWGLKKFMGREYDGIHRISFLIDLNGNIAHVFNKFKTKEHHQVVLDEINKLQNN